MANSRREFFRKSALGAVGLAFGVGKLYSKDLTHHVSNGAAWEGVTKDLMGHGKGWTTFSPRKQLSPVFRKQQGIGSTNFTISGNNNPESIGCWKRGLPLLKKGHIYHIECKFQTENVTDLHNNIRAFVTKGNAEYVDFYPQGEGGGANCLKAEFSPVEDEAKLEVRLFLVNGGQGKVQWDEVWLTDITEEYKPRLINVAAVSGQPPDVGSASEAVGFYCSRIDKIGTANLDLICLPEFINVVHVPGEPANLAEPIPGPTSKQLGEKAKQYNTYIVAALLERDNSHIYNTAILIGRDGKVMGKYHKAHLPFSEKFNWGVTPGNGYKVFETDFGKVGLMVCYDNHFPEVARILAVKGADLIAFPNYGDGREWPNGAHGSVWEPYMQTRAIDSHVAIVSAVNSGRSCIVNGGGEILAVNGYSNKEPGSIVSARIDLNSSVTNSSRMPIQKRYLLLRRPETYEPLIKQAIIF